MKLINFLSHLLVGFMFLACVVPEETVPGSSDTTSVESGPEKRAENFYTGKTVTKNKENLYLAFEKIDDSNRDFWKKYEEQSRKIAKTLEMVPSHKKQNKLDSLKAGAKDVPGIAYPKTVQKLLGYDDAKYNKLIDYIAEKTDLQKHGEEQILGSYGKVFSDVLGGLAGLLYIFEPPPDVDVHIIYGANKPITKPVKNSDYQENKNFFENFGNIVISVSGLDHIKLPIVQHYGITKNVTSFFSQEDRTYPAVSTILHGFAAAVWLSFFDNKKYMVTTPIGKMGEILQKSLSKENVTLDEYPDEIKKLVQQNKFQDLTSGFGGRKTTVNLKALSKLYVSK